MLKIAKLEPFYTGISAPDKYANLQHNLIIFLNQALKKCLATLILQQSLKSIQPMDAKSVLQESRTTPVCWPSALRKTVSSSITKHHRNTMPTTGPFMVYYHYTADPLTMKVHLYVDFFSTNTYHILHGPQVVESVDVELQIQRIFHCMEGQNP